MSGQLSLWTRASLNPAPRVKEAMRRALKTCGLSREQVVDQMNGLARAEGIRTNGRAGKVTIEILDKWVAESGDNLIPWKLLPIFCLVTGDIVPIGVLAAPLEAEVINRKDAKILRWAKAELKSKELRKIKRQLEAEIEP